MKGDEPLAGRTIVVTRPADQAEPLIGLLESRGATALHLPLVEIADPFDGGAGLRARLAKITAYDWVVLTSANAARRVATALARHQGHPLVAAVGPATAAALPHADLLPPTSSARGLIDAFPRGGGTVLLPHGDRAPETLGRGLRGLGWTVDAVVAYATLTIRPSAHEMTRAHAADAVVFASGSAVSAWRRAFGHWAPQCVVAIGPPSARSARSAGFVVDAIALEPSPAGLVEALVSAFSRYG